MATEAACPVQHITIERAAVTFDLRVAMNDRIGMQSQDAFPFTTEDPLLDSFVTVRVLLHGSVPVVVTDPAV